MRSVIAALFTFYLVSSALSETGDARRWDPPDRYNHPYTGELIVHRFPPKRVIEACQRIDYVHPVANWFTQRKGCALPKDGYCIVVVIDRPAYGTTPEAVLTHEIGHCNGWPSNHPK